CATTLWRFAAFPRTLWQQGVARAQPHLPESAMNHPCKLLLILAALLTQAATARAATPIPDKNLETAVRAVLQQPKADMTDEKLNNVYVLEASGKEIKDLTGLEKCKNLSLLRLTKNQVADLKPLQGLTNLQSLDLADNKVEDIAPLAGLTKLQ